MPLPFKRAEEWLSSLTGKVDLLKISTPIKVLKEERIDLPTSRGKRRFAVGQYDVSFSFRGSNGADLGGAGRLFVPSKRPRERMPIVVSMHYEMNAEGAARFLSKGIAVLTPHGGRSYQAANLLGHGISHSVAMARLPRRFPFVDQRRVVLFGGSAGGYHALMAASFVFPVTAVYAAVPPLNLKYNMSYLLKNDEHNVNPELPDKPPAPIVKIVKPIAEATVNGGRAECQSWKPFSPVYRTDLITSPTLVTYITADTLVPTQQLSPELVHRAPSGMWPEGFTFEMDDIVPPEERASLLDVLDPADYQLRVHRVPRDSPTINKTRQDLSPEELDRIRRSRLRWSKTKRFSIYVLDEGPPEPFCGHAKYHHDVDDSAFLEHHFCQASLATSMLTDEKLSQLMQRFSGTEPDNGREYDDGGSWAITRLDNAHIEKWCIAEGLHTFVEGNPRNLSRLVRTYRKLPKELQVLDLHPLRPEGRLDKNPLGVLLNRQLVELVESGDLELARYTMRRILALD